MFETFNYRIQGNDHRIGTHEINKISLSCFDGKIYLQIYLQNNEYDELTLVY